MTRRAPLCLLFALLAVASFGTVAPADTPRSAKAASYPFQTTPAEALARLQTLGAPAPAADELKLFARAAAGQPFDDQTFADACLLASGVLDPDMRQDYCARLDRITEDARRATAD